MEYANNIQYPVGRNGMETLDQSQGNFGSGLGDISDNSSDIEADSKKIHLILINDY